MKNSTVSRSVWQFFLLLLFAVWWGGLTFYALIVVPIGSDVTSAVEQGFVTQRVTFWHNTLLVSITLCSLIEGFKKRSQAWVMLGILLVLVTLGLLMLHQNLGSFIDISELSVPPEFYRRHAIYLWITTIEWILGLVGAWLYVRDLNGSLAGDEIAETLGDSAQVPQN